MKCGVVGRKGSFSYSMSATSKPNNEIEIGRSVATKQREGARMAGLKMPARRSDL